jgi:hypothetical protein
MIYKKLKEAIFMGKRYVIIREFLEYSDLGLPIIYDNIEPFLSLEGANEYMKKSLSDFEYGNPLMDYKIFKINHQTMFDDFSKEHIEIIQEIVYKTIPKHKHRFPSHSCISDTCRMYIKEIEEEDVSETCQLGSIFIRLYKYDVPSFKSLVNDISSKLLLELMLHIYITNGWLYIENNTIDLRNKHIFDWNIFTKIVPERVDEFVQLFNNLKDLGKYFWLNNNKLCFNYDKKGLMINIPLNALFVYLDSEEFNIALKIIKAIIKNKEG